MRQREHELQPPGLAFRQRPDLPLRTDSQHLDEMCGVRVIPRRIVRGDVLNQPSARHPFVVMLVRLRDVAHLRPHLRTMRGGVEPEDVHTPRIRPDEIEQHLQRGALPRAVRADEDVHRSMRYAQVDAGERRLFAVARGQSMGRDGE
jgi:hypothetical protein